MQELLNSPDFNLLLNGDPFSFSQEAKNRHLFPLVRMLHEHHLLHNPEYNRIHQVLFHGHTPERMADIPYVPVSIFKQRQLKSISDNEVYKVITSSGTTGQIPSRIYLDKTTAQIQTKVLSKIMGRILGPSRIPMLIIDSKSVLSDRQSFSARGVGILGLSFLGRDHCYLLNDQMEPDFDALDAFIDKYSGQPIFIFGFTFMVWQYLQPVLKKRAFDLSKAIMVHSGGWKKLIEISVDNDTFKSEFKKISGLNSIYNFYGMAEQVGAVFLENEKGMLHCPAFSDVIIRNPSNMEEQPPGKEGLIQVVSCLPFSYPGHSILTEDIGVIEGEDTSGLEWKGRYFRILGRVKKAEVRGCSDTFERK